ncbi:MAG: hypothetical protein E7Z87_01355 [Cyanobacteria bacterium SIG26]|nr:hypothetical protein [Cyanobacteria bacterium SIG26]
MAKYFATYINAQAGVEPESGCDKQAEQGETLRYRRCERSERTNLRFDRRENAQAGVEPESGCDKQAEKQMVRCNW